MSNKVKKPHTIKVVGVSCLNGTYKLNVSGRINPLQLFQCAVPGTSTFVFKKLPSVMSKRDAVAYLIGQPESNDPNVLGFLNGLLAKYDTVLNKVPGKRGRPKGSKNKPKVGKITVKIANPEAFDKHPAKVAKKTEAVKVVKAMIEPMDAKPVSDADKQRQMEANREKLRQVARARQQKVA